MPSDLIAAIKIALASRGVAVSDADAETVRSAVERVWGTRPKEESIFALRDAWAALRLIRWSLEQVALPCTLTSRRKP